MNLHLITNDFLEHAVQDQQNAEFLPPQLFKNHTTRLKITFEKIEKVKNLARCLIEKPSKLIYLLPIAEFHSAPKHFDFSGMATNVL